MVKLVGKHKIYSVKGRRENATVQTGKVRLPVVGVNIIKKGQLIFEMQIPIAANYTFCITRNNIFDNIKVVLHSIYSFVIIYFYFSYFLKDVSWIIIKINYDWQRIWFPFFTTINKICTAINYDTSGKSTFVFMFPGKVKGMNLN